MTWTAEPHGSGIGVYSGRTGMQHGLRLFQIEDGDMHIDQHIARMLEAVNSYSAMKARIEALERERDALREQKRVMGTQAETAYESAHLVGWNEAIEAAAKQCEKVIAGDWIVGDIRALKR